MLFSPACCCAVLGLQFGQFLLVSFLFIIHRKSILIQRLLSNDITVSLVVIIASLSPFLCEVADLSFIGVLYVKPITCTIISATTKDGLVSPRRDVVASLSPQVKSVNLYQTKKICILRHRAAASFTACLTPSIIPVCLIHLSCHMDVLLRCRCMLAVLAALALVWWTHCI